MKELFDLFDERLRLTDPQDEDARTKYSGVCKTIHKKYHPDREYDGTTKYLFGSYKKKTNIRPILPDQDVDVLVKMPIEEFERYDAYSGNGQAALLQDIKDILKDTYTTTDKIKPWSKVILVNFADGKHNVELLPAWENPDGTFTIPNSENGGSWENFDPRQGIESFQTSNTKSGGLTAQLSRFLKAWKRENATLGIKSYELEEHVINFLDTIDVVGVSISMILLSLFEFMESRVGSHLRTYLETAIKRSQKAVEYEDESKYESAVIEWKKIFGDMFPSVSNLKKAVTLTEFAPDEDFIEGLYPVFISPTANLKIDCIITQNGYMPTHLSDMIRQHFELNKYKELQFFVQQNNIEKPYIVKWKVRNYGIEAENAHNLRGEITNDFGQEKKIENTKYAGEHYVECYIIKNNICVARAKITVPISTIS